MDPEIGRSIVDLKMVRDITVGDGNVYVKIALTVAHYAFEDRTHRPGN